MFAGSRGGPRFLNFVPNDCGIHAGKLLVGSGQTFGGFELISPLYSSNVANDSIFFQPDLSAGESMTTVSIYDGEIVIGTSCGRVLEYALTSYESTVYSQRRSQSKEALDLPPFSPDPSKVTIDPYVLCSTQSSGIPPGWNIFDSYSMAVDPIVSEEEKLYNGRYVTGRVNSSTLGGPMSKKPLLAPSPRWLSKELQGKLIASADSGGIGKVLPTSSVTGQGDLLAAETQSDTTEKGVILPNPNKILSSKLFASCYDATADPRKNIIEGEESSIPQRYRMTIRNVANFDYSRYNETGLWVGRFYSVIIAFSLFLFLIETDCGYCSLRNLHQAGIMPQLSRIPSLAR